jgi:type IV pilus biogenesis/stability protein PilW
MTSPRAHPGLPRLLQLLAALLACAPLACAHSLTTKEREAAEIHYQLGAEALRNGRREEAMREFDQTLKVDDRHVAAHLGRGLVFQFSGKLADAEREYRRALEIDPKSPDAHNALGQLLAQTSHLEQAITEFDQALDDPTYRDAYLARCNKGQALYALNRREEGLAEIKTCLSLAPRYCPGHRELGRIELEDGRLKDALDSFRRYTELCPKAADAWFQRGLVEMKMGDPEKAKEAFQICAGLNGDSVVEECRKRVGALQ